ncbi:hypothetical protein CHUAL_011219 [Chamberlinius hualienensis]
MTTLKRSTTEMLQMCSFDGSKSTKGASKLRRDLINAEISNLRDLLPLPSSTRQRLSQLQLMALVCVYVRKSNYFQQVFRKMNIDELNAPNFGFSKALSGFLMMMTQNGKLLYISDNAAEYLGHSMEDLLIQGDSVYDIIDKQDHAAVQSELLRSLPGHQHLHSYYESPIHPHQPPLWEERMFLCRMNVSRNARRQMRFGDQKVVLIRGHFLSFLPLCSRNEPVFLANCTPMAMPETRECVVQGATAIFTSLHSMDMKYIHIEMNGEHHLGQKSERLLGTSWYHLLHWDHLKEAQHKHRHITQTESDRACVLLVRMQSFAGDHSRWIWAHVVLQVKDNMEGMQNPIILCTNQVLSDREAEVMRSHTWLYQYYNVQNKLPYFESHSTRSTTKDPSTTNQVTSSTPQVTRLQPTHTIPSLNHNTVLSYPISHEAIHRHHHYHYRQPSVNVTNGSYQHNTRNYYQGGSTTTTYTQLLDDNWLSIETDGNIGEGGLIARSSYFRQSLLTLNRKCVENVNVLNEEDEIYDSLASSPKRPQIVPDMTFDHLIHKTSAYGMIINEQYVPQVEELDSRNASPEELSSLDSDVVEFEAEPKCLCNINTCVTMCTCCRQTSKTVTVDKPWILCCTAGLNSESTLSEEDEMLK